MASQSPNVPPFSRSVLRDRTSAHSSGDACEMMSRSSSPFATFVQHFHSTAFVKNMLHVYARLIEYHDVICIFCCVTAF